MHFQLIDDVLEQDEDRIVALKQVSLAEEYLGDHFPGYPVLPGVLMLEAMVQAARRLLSARVDEPLVLGAVKAVKYGSMVRPGERLRVEVTVLRETDDGAFACRGTGTVERSDPAAETAVAVSGRFTMRPVRRGMS